MLQFIALPKYEHCSGNANICWLLSYNMWTNMARSTELGTAISNLARTMFPVTFRGPLFIPLQWMYRQTDGQQQNYMPPTF